MMSPLSVVWEVSPYIVTIGRFELRWYSLMFVLGFILGYYMMKRFYLRENLPADKLMDPLLYVLVIATLVGARLGHCFFYDPGYYLTSAHWTEIFMPWKGGLASHGGTIGVFLGLWWYAHHYGRKYGFDLMWILDRVVIPICFVGALIRLGNLFNSEIYGDVTDLPWGFVFTRNGETVPRHPTQIYEALSYVILGFALFALYRFRMKKLYKGTLFGIFFIVLFGVRFLIEFIKLPQEDWESGMLLDMGQILSIPFILAGAGVLVWSLWKKAPAMLPEQKTVNKKIQ